MVPTSAICQSTLSQGTTASLFWANDLKTRSACFRGGGNDRRQGTDRQRGTIEASPSSGKIFSGRKGIMPWSEAALRKSLSRWRDGRSGIPKAQPPWTTGKYLYLDRGNCINRAIPSISGALSRPGIITARRSGRSVWNCGERKALIMRAPKRPRF
jgi:hypothetical protein